MIVDVVGTVYCDKSECLAKCRAVVRVFQFRHHVAGMRIVEFDRTDFWYGWTATLCVDQVCHAWCPLHRPERPHQWLVEG